MLTTVCETFDILKTDRKWSDLETFIFVRIRQNSKFVSQWGSQAVSKWGSQAAKQWISEALSLWGSQAVR